MESLAIPSQVAGTDAAELRNGVGLRCQEHRLRSEKQKLFAPLAPPHAAVSICSN